MATANMIGSYNYALVALSVLIAMFASYAALDLAGRVTAAGGWTRAIWLLGGAGAMGTGVWSMHYIGMLAFILPIPVAYHWPTVLLSLVAAILASVIALGVASRQKMGAFRAFAGSVLMGAGIASMHYIGMAAMRLPAICQFNSLLVVLSVVFAVLISLAALWITFHFRDEKAGAGREKLAGALVMGAAIPVMHYTGMAAASFSPSGRPADLSHAVSISALGTAGIAGVTFVVLGLALLTSWVDRRFAVRTLELQEKKLQRSEVYWAEAQRLSHTGSFGWKPSTGERIWSEETFRIFQYDRTMTPTMDLVLQRVHPEDAAPVQQTLKSAARDGKDFDHEYRLLMPDGSTKYVHAVARALSDESGSVEFAGAVMDITAAKRAEQTLRESEAYLAEAQRLSHTGSFGWSVSSGYIVWSDETFRIFEIDPAIKPTVDLILRRTHPEDRPFVQATLDEATRERKAFDFEHRLRMPNSSVKYLRVVGHPSTGHDSGNFEFVGAVTDITESKQAEESLRRSEAYLAEAQRLSHTGSWAWNLGTKRQFWSVETFHIFGFDPNTTTPTRDTFLGSVHPDDRVSIELAETELFKGNDAEYNYRIILPDGSTKYITSVAHPIHNNSGQVIEFVGTVLDVTERNRAEALRDGESRILEMIARDAPLEEILVKLVRVVEAQFAGLLCSVLLLDEDGEHVRHGAAPSLPEPYTKAIDGLPIGPKAGSCGTAMYRREPVVVADILEDPLWEPYRDVVAPYGLRACWSTPILAHSGNALGSFAMYYREPRSPSPTETRALEMATHLAGIAMERKLTHELLQRSEAYLAEAQRLSHTGSWAFNAREAVYWSEETYNIFEYDRTVKPTLELVFRRVHPEDAALVRQTIERALQDGKDFEHEYRLLMPDGCVKHVHVVARAITDESGRVEFVGAVMDVTAAKRVERTLRESEAYLAEAQRLTHTGSGAWRVPEGDALYLSDEWYRIYGFDPKEGLSAWNDRVQRMHPEDRANVQEIKDRAISAKSDYEVDHRILLPDGTVKHTHTVGHPVLNGSGDVEQFVCTMMDVTERKQAEKAREALRQAQADLARVSRVTTMGELTASLAHEVNQPIAASVTDANTCVRWLAGDTPNIEEGRAAAMRVVKDVKRAGEIVSRIRQLFKKGTSEREFVDVNEIIREMIVLLRGETTGYSILVGTDLAADLPQIMADRIQLQQVLMNLMVNSIDAMKDVVGTRELAIKSRRAESDEVLVSVNDTGIGLPPKQTEQIFNAFFTTKPHGTGMGLRISRSIIELHGGRLWAADNCPRGASFCFTLPTKAEATE